MNPSTHLLRGSPSRRLARVVTTWSLMGAAIGVAAPKLAASGDDVAAVAVLERPAQPGLQGSFLVDPTTGLRFRPKGEPPDRSLLLEPGWTVRFGRNDAEASAIPPPFRVLIGQTARISGMLREFTEKSVSMDVPWQTAPVRVARPGVQALVQRPGESQVLVEPFRRIDPARWTVSGGPEIVADGKSEGAGRGGVKIPAGGSALAHKIGEPVATGRVEFSYYDAGKVTPGQSWVFELGFRGPGGPKVVRVVLGWSEESLAVESPEGPTLAVQRLARGAGWHRLSARFGPERTAIGVDGQELAHGKGPAGPLDSVRILTAGNGPAPALAGLMGEFQISRLSEPPVSLEIDPTQDEARLVVGDQLFGRILRGGPERLEMVVVDRPITLTWGEVSGVHFRREPATAQPVEGTLVRVGWLGDPGARPRDLDFAEGALTALTDHAVTVKTPYAGELVIPRRLLASLQVLDPGWLLVIDPSAHHLGDNISTTPPILDPPVPEGGTLELTADIPSGPGPDDRPTWLVLDVIQVVGESSGSPFASLILKGELRTYVVVNGTRVDYLNRHVKTANESPERLRIPIPKRLIKPGPNRIRFEQTGIANDPTFFDDLGILQIAVERPRLPGTATQPPSTSPVTNPPGSP